MNIQIKIGDDQASPEYTFVSSQVMSIDTDTACDLVGNELSIDTFDATVQNEMIVYELVSTNGSTLVTTTGDTLTAATGDLTAVPHGSEVNLYDGNTHLGTYYVDYIEQVGVNLYTVHAFSFLGLLDERKAGGGYCNMTVAEWLVALGVDAFPYECDETAGAQIVYGYLPYDTVRNNLGRILFAASVSITRTDNGIPRFSVIDDVTATYGDNLGVIPAGDIYIGGTQKYQAPASRVEVVSYEYIADEANEPTVLFDNTEDPDALADHEKVFIDEAFSSVAVDETIGEMTIDEEYDPLKGYAVVSGWGKLLGIPYTEVATVHTVDNPGAQVENIVSVSGNTMISPENVENVLERLAAYYFYAKTVSNAIVFSGQKCGRKFEFTDPLRRVVRGYLTKMSVGFSQTSKAECEFAVNYAPPGLQFTFSHRDVISSSQFWTVPEGVTRIKFILIGGGNAGQNGEDGQQGTVGILNNNVQTRGIGGAGGRGGSRGEGGYVYTEIVRVTPGTLLTIAVGAGGSATGTGVGGNTTLRVGGFTYSSAFGSRAGDEGFLDGGVYYAKPGTDGIAGGKGGDAGFYPIIAASHPEAVQGKTSEPENGEMMEQPVDYFTDYVHIVYGGGTADNWTGVSYGGNGGGGGAYGSEDNNIYADCTVSWNGSFFTGESYSGKGQDAGQPEATETVYGCGGNGGHGGGGSGGCGNVLGETFHTRPDGWDWYTWDAVTIAGAPPPTPSEGGTGSQGSNGYKGCAILYY